MSELIDKDAFLKQERKWYCENCDRRKGVKNGRKCFVYEIGEVPCRACDVDDVLDDLECFETIDAVPVEMRKERGMSELIDRGDVLGVVSCFFEDSFIEDADVNCAELEREINRIPTISAPRWVRAEEPPDTDEYVLAFDCDIVVMASFDGEKWWQHDTYESFTIFPSHWMPLPEPPKEEV